MFALQARLTPTPVIGLGSQKSLCCVWFECIIRQRWAAGSISMNETAKQRLYHILERGRPEDSVSQVVDWMLIVLIVANVAAAATTGPFHGSLLLMMNLVLA